MAEFKVVSPFEPQGDSLRQSIRLQTACFRVTSFRFFWALQAQEKHSQWQSLSNAYRSRPIVIAHNKTLAAQLCSEFREFFPNNAVEYFVSYYDYYQPEAYIASSEYIH